MRMIFHQVDIGRIEIEAHVGDEAPFIHIRSEQVRKDGPTTSWHRASCDHPSSDLACVD
jgi:hypothetical protein